MSEAGRKFRSIRFFSLCAFGFALVVGFLGLLIDLQQHEVLNEAQVMESRTMPEVMRLQRLGRNLEQLRSTGDGILSSVTTADRQDLLFMMTMISQHPSIQQSPGIAQLATQAAKLIADASLSIQQDPASVQAWRNQWLPVGLQLSQAADDAMAGAGRLLTNQVDTMSAVAQRVRYQMWLITGLAGVCVLLFVWVLQVKILRPLLKINDAMRGLNTNLAPPVLPESRITEIRAIESVILALHEAQKKTASIQSELAFQAGHDMLTELPNRRAFMQSAERAALRALTAGRSATVGMADIDLFKLVNDRYGHAAGDVVLRDCARLIELSFRSTDLICRYGGEEFAFVILDSDAAESLRLAERLRERVAGHAFSTPEGATLPPVTVSIGLAAIGPKGLESALSDADAALYRAKAEGRNCTRTTE